MGWAGWGVADFARASEDGFASGTGLELLKPIYFYLFSMNSWV